MPIERLSIWGNPHIGVYIFANDTIAITPPGLEKKVKDLIETTLNVELVETTIGGMRIVGVLVAGNNKGIVLPRFVKDEEVKAIKRAFDGVVEVVSGSRITALGNAILVNDRAALLHPEVEKEFENIVKDVLDVEVVRGTIAQIPTVGSVALITNKGGLVHPDASDSELKFLEDFFSVPIDVGTVNFGIGFIRSGLVANTHGALVGEKTTGPEMLRISQVLGVK
ncbi:MAG: translation initiation factor IF-6 [Thermoprotei archaeon]|nr:MAG: translation initiation factor IF-6 [Thermoprotei archaeon]